MFLDTFFGQMSIPITKSNWIKSNICVVIKKIKSGGHFKLKEKTFKKEINFHTQTLFLYILELNFNELLKENCSE